MMTNEMIAWGLLIWMGVNVWVLNLLVLGILEALKELKNNRTEADYGFSTGGVRRGSKITGI